MIDERFDYKGNRADLSGWAKGVLNDMCRDNIDNLLYNLKAFFTVNGVSQELDTKQDLETEINKGDLHKIKQVENRKINKVGDDQITENIHLVIRKLLQT